MSGLCEWSRRGGGSRIAGIPFSGWARSRRTCRLCGKWKMKGAAFPAYQVTGCKMERERGGPGKPGKSGTWLAGWLGLGESGEERVRGAGIAFHMASELWNFLSSEAGGGLRRWCGMKDRRGRAPTLSPSGACQGVLQCLPARRPSGAEPGNEKWRERPAGCGSDVLCVWGVPPRPGGCLRPQPCAPRIPPFSRASGCWSLSWGSL